MNVNVNETNALDIIISKIGDEIDHRINKILDEREKKNTERQEWVSVTVATKYLGKSKQSLWNYCREKMAIRERFDSPRKQSYNMNDLENFKKNPNYRYCLEN